MREPELLGKRQETSTVNKKSLDCSCPPAETFAVKATSASSSSLICLRHTGTAFPQLYWCCPSLVASHSDGPEKDLEVASELDPVHPKETLLGHPHFPPPIHPLFKAAGPGPEHERSPLDQTPPRGQRELHHQFLQGKL